jgi:phospholipid transport system substrate-binding protein
MRTLIALLALFLSIPVASAQLLAPAARPDAMMSALTAEVMAVLNKDAGAARTNEFAQLIERRIVPVFDFQRMTRLALGRTWRTASAAQQEALVAQFKTLLVRTYSSALLDYRDQPIDYKPLRAAAGETEVTVRSAMRRPGVEPLTIDYDMVVRLHRARARHRRADQGARGQESPERVRHGRRSEARPDALDLRRGTPGAVLNP